MIYFSIVVPLYNKDKYIQRCVDSILRQSYQYYEIIIVDDGSTDNSLANLNLYSNNKKIRVISQKNQGVSAARNKGVSEANNDYICFLDADDVWNIHHLFELCNTIKKYPQCKAFSTKVSNDSNIKNILKDDEALITYTILDNYFEQLIIGNISLNSSSVCVEKYALESVGGFPNGEPYGEDGFVWALLYLNYKIAICSYPGSFYDKKALGRSANLYSPEQQHPLVRKVDSNEITCADASFNKYIRLLRLSFCKKWLLFGDKEKFYNEISKVKLCGIKEYIIYKILPLIPNKILLGLYLLISRVRNE